MITACVVIGPGSILTSSNVGATNGFAMAWVVVVACICMQIYMGLGARLGLTADRSPAELITERAGRWLAVLIGCSVFFISAAFQFGNNLGVDSAFRVFPLFQGFDYIVILFNALSIAFLFGFRNLYRAVELLMTAFVGLMLVSFAINLAFAIFLAPPAETAAPTGRGSFLDVSVLGLVGTTFVITAAYYQTYLVRQKGWGFHQLQDGLLDTRVGAVIMALITLMIMSTAAIVLRGHQLGSVADVALQLEPLFGTWGQIVFCVGLFSAAYSSFLVNSMIGGFVLADGLGLGSRPDQLWPKVMTTAVLLTGMVVALIVIKLRWQPVPAIVLAQAVTVVAAPVLAGTLLWLTSLRSVMGEQRVGWLTKLPAGLAFLLLLAMAGYTAAVKIPEGLQNLRASSEQAAVSGAEPDRHQGDREHR